MTYIVTADSGRGQRFTSERAAISAARTIRGSARYESVTVTRNDINDTVIWTERDW